MKIIKMTKIILIVIHLELFNSKKKKITSKYIIKNIRNLVKKEKL